MFIRKIITCSAQIHTFRSLKRISHKNLAISSMINNQHSCWFSSNKNPIQSIKSRIQNTLVEKGNKQALQHIRELEVLIKSTIQKGNIQEAVDLIKFKVSVLTLIFGKDNEIVISNMRTLGDFYYRMENYKDALTTLQETQSLQKKNKLQSKQGYSLTLMLLGSIYRNMEQLQKSAETFGKVLKWTQENQQKDLRLKVAALGDLARVENMLNKSKNAVKLYQQLLSIIQSSNKDTSLGISPVEASAYYFQAAFAESDNGDKSKSKPLIQKGIKNLGQYNSEKLKYFEMAIETYEDLGMINQGYELLNQIYEKGSNKEKIQLLMFKLDFQFRENNYEGAQETCKILLERVEKEKGYEKQDKEDILDEYRQVYEQLKRKNAQNSKGSKSEIIDSEKAELPLNVYKAKKEISQAIYDGSGLFSEKKLSEARQMFENTLHRLNNDKDLIELQKQQNWKGTCIFLLRNITKQQKNIDQALRYAYMLDEELNQEKYNFMLPVYVWNRKEIADLYETKGDKENYNKAMEKWVELVNEKSNGRDFISAEFQLWRSTQLILSKNYTQARLSLTKAFMIYQAMAKHSDQMNFRIQMVQNLRERIQKEQKQNSK